jgi:hypothetical protein
MNHLDQSLQRLFKAAARAPRPAESLSANQEARLLAHCRTHPAEDEIAVFACLFRRAVVCASVLMLLSIAWNYLEREPDMDPPAAASLTGFQVAMDVVP